LVKWKSEYDDPEQVSVPGSPLTHQAEYPQAVFQPGEIQSIKAGYSFKKFTNILIEELVSVQQ
jgi:hypothetical protein